MTDVRLDSRVLSAVEDALEPYADRMFAAQGGRWMATVEFAHQERSERQADVAPEGDGPETVEVVKLRIVALEIAPDDEADERVRQVLRDFKRAREGDHAGAVQEELDIHDAAVNGQGGMPTGPEWGDSAERVPVSES